MRHLIFALPVLLLILLSVAGCSGNSFYDDSGNWVIRNNDIPEYSSEYDVFLVYPTQAGKTSGSVLNWKQEGVTNEIRCYVSAMTSDFARHNVRVFAPFVPQLGHEDYLRLAETRKDAPEECDLMKTGLESAIRHTVMALKYYLKHYNQEQRCFVLVGHEQGAAILYEAMKQTAAVTPEKGFAAAYFQGLPAVTQEKIRRDFGSRGISPAAGRYDYGVIAVFNTAASGGASCVINPLNWHTDAVPAGAEENPDSVFYARTNGKVRHVPHFCGAVADPAKGIIRLTGVPADARVNLDDRTFPSDVWGVFSGSIGRNAGERVREHLFRQQLNGAK